MIAEGTAHLRFCMKLYKMQIENGLYFVHEHPDGAKSWDDPAVRKLIEDWRVWKVKGDIRFCRLQIYKRWRMSRDVLRIGD